MWGNELRCHSAEHGPLDREQKEAADDSSMRGCTFSFQHPGVHRGACVRPSRLDIDGEISLLVKAGTEVSMRCKTHCRPFLASDHPFPRGPGPSFPACICSPWPAADLSMYFPKICFTTAPQPGSSSLPDYLHCSLCLHLPLSPLRGLPSHPSPSRPLADSQADDAPE